MKIPAEEANVGGPRFLRFSDLAVLDLEGSSVQSASLTDDVARGPAPLDDEDRLALTSLSVQSRPGSWGSEAEAPASPVPGQPWLPLLSASEVGSGSGEGTSWAPGPGSPDPESSEVTTIVVTSGSSSEGTKVLPFAASLKPGSITQPSQPIPLHASCGPAISLSCQWWLVPDDPPLLEARWAVRLLWRFRLAPPSTAERSATWRSVGREPDVVAAGQLEDAISGPRTRRSGRPSVDDGRRWRQVKPTANHGQSSSSPRSGSSARMGDQSSSWSNE